MIMKKLALLLAVLLILGCVAGCGSSGVTQEEYDALKDQLEALQEEQAELQQKLEVAEQAAEEMPDVTPEPSAEAPAPAETPEVTPEPESSVEEPSALEAAPEPDSSAEEAPADKEKNEAQEAEIRGGTNQADSVLVPLNTRMHGTLHDGQNMFFSFHTGASKDSVYHITVVDKEDFDLRVHFYLLDELGTELSDRSAYRDGIASTITVSDLSPDSDYYLRLGAQNTNNDGSKSEAVRFALTIKDSEEQSDGVSTTDNLLDAAGAPDDVESIVVGHNQDDAAPVPVNVTVSGTLKDGLGDWFAFTTDSSPETTYQISVTNKSTEDLRVGTYVFDEFGTEVASGDARNDGVTKTFACDGLSTNTIYYVRLVAQYTENSGTRNETVGYSFIIKCANESPAEDTASLEAAKETVFDVPFELNETQVRFVGDEATFIDENEARTALAPVAEIILAHPDHTILIAGTTATVGTQAECLELSGQRAEAVKTMLVQEFGVPADQLITIGLGYEADPFVRGRDRDANGNQIETEAVKNRRVVVLDADSEMGRSILGS